MSSNLTIHIDDDNCAESRVHSTVIAHNDMYHSEKFRTDGNGNFDRNGDYTCGEYAVDIKGAAESHEERIRVIGNRMWGASFRLRASS